VTSSFNHTVSSSDYSVELYDAFLTVEMEEMKRSWSSRRYYRAICVDGLRRTTKDLNHPTCLVTYEFTKLFSHAARTQSRRFPSKDIFSFVEADAFHASFEVAP
jgi:hypothetical protein